MNEIKYQLMQQEGRGIVPLYIETLFEVTQDNDSNVFVDGAGNAFVCDVSQLKITNKYNYSIKGDFIIVKQVDNDE